MTKHVFGGDWTTEKLERLRKYLCAYTTIFTRNPRAHHFTTIYVDAFAGTGHRVDASRHADDPALFDEEPDADAEAYKTGSACIALEVEPPFDRFIFIERSASRAGELKQAVADSPVTRDAVTVVPGEANDFLLDWCGRTDWSHHRAVVFLDPYGMQVNWATVDALAKTKAIDLWLLFPLGVAVNRLLTRAKPPPDAWADALTRMFGTVNWQTAFYPKRDEPTLFGVESVRRKDVNWDKIKRFFVARLKSIFCNVANNPLALRNSTNTPIYLLCFAAANPKGGPTAVKIAQHVLKP